MIERYEIETSIKENILDGIIMEPPPAMEYDVLLCAYNDTIALHHLISTANHENNVTRSAFFDPFKCLMFQM